MFYSFRNFFKGLIVISFYPEIPNEQTLTFFNFQCDFIEYLLQYLVQIKGIVIIIEAREFNAGKT